MSASIRREYRESAPVPVRRQKHLLRRHWLTGALICGLLALTAATGLNLYRTELHFQQVRKESAALDSELQEAKAKNQTLQQRLSQVTNDKYLELAAKAMGFVYPHETVYQTGAGAGH